MSAEIGQRPKKRGKFMGQVPKKEVTPDELMKLGALLEEHNIEALIARHKPQSLSIRFDAEWLDDGALAASFPRLNSANPHFITLSPLLLEYGLTDRVSFSTVILHELGHVVDRTRNWTRHATLDLENREALEYEADDFVVACGWKDGLIETLRRSIALGPENRASEGMAKKRLDRLSEAN
jgi:hypothetical protein